MPSLGPLEILVVLVVALLVFGPNKLPDISRQIGRAMREFRRVTADFEDEVRSAFEDHTPPTLTAPSLPEGTPAPPVPMAPLPPPPGAELPTLHPGAVPPPDVATGESHDSDH